VVVVVVVVDDATPEMVAVVVDVTPVVAVVVVHATRDVVVVVAVDTNVGWPSSSSSSFHDVVVVDATWGDVVVDLVDVAWAWGRRGEVEVVDVVDVARQRSTMSSTWRAGGSRCRSPRSRPKPLDGRGFFALALPSSVFLWGPDERDAHCL
jgi:hypothetical protein